MSTLASLPEDIRYLLLKKAADLDTLTSLILASSAFYSTFKRYRDTICNTVLENEIRQHKREALFLLAFSDRITRLDASCAMFNLAVNQYLNFGINGAYTLDGTDKSTLDERNLNDAKKSHLHIRSQCKVFVEDTLKFHHNERGKGDEPPIPATGAEKQRIIRALYRLWVFISLCCERLSPVPFYRGQTLSITSEQVLKLFESWGFWGVLEIKLMINFYWRTLEPYIELWWGQSGSSPGYVGQLTIFMSIMVHFFPRGIQQWIDYREETECMRHHLPCMDQSHPEYVHSNDKSEPWNYWLNMFDDWRNGQLFGASFEGPGDIERWPDTPPRRLCRPGHPSYGHDEVNGVKSWVRPFSWRETPDFRVCLWDDWRLKDWGYAMPDFESEAEAQSWRQKRNFLVVEQVWVFEICGDPETNGDQVIDNGAWIEEIEEQLFSI
ncbi:hypothetical protein TWF694_005390 [Orbilia ellipsospora]|uniref:F-box domain-containing protein n=1 Tax=Orbilia ellipsospora TaxID=2528407 RepID=A0AAV9WV45_9PEZI